MNKYYLEHKEEIIQKAHQNYLENKDKILDYCHRRYEQLKDEISAKAKKRYQENKDIIKARTAKYIKEKWANDPVFRIKMRLRHRLREAFKRFSKNGKVGISKDYGIDYEAIFNHIGPCPGNLKDYHIDHIRPLSLFDFDDLEQVKRAFAPENHQWLRKEENLAKHNKVIETNDGN